jgi:uncharacterized membrane protein
MPVPVVPPGQRPGDPERIKFFTDAVVAIARTLLILPLLENVNDAARTGTSTQAFVSDHGNQLFSFVLSFVVIGAFWGAHERVFAFVGHWTDSLRFLNGTWMLTIVFLPVATAMAGAMDTDRLQIVIYVGTMLVSTLVMGAMIVIVRRTPAVWETDTGPGTDGLDATLSLSILFVLALLIGVVSPDRIGFLALLLLLLARPLQVLIERMSGRRRLGKTSGA